MLKTCIYRPLLLLTLFAVYGSASATNTFFFLPADSNSSPGQQIQLDLWMDFDSTTLGGPIDVRFDSGILQFVDWQAAPLGDPGFINTPYLYGDVLYHIAIGDFDTGLTGLNFVGSLWFVVAADALITATATVSAMDGHGPFIDFTTLQIMQLEFVDAQVHIVQAPVPVPGALWMLAAALFGVFGFAKGRSSA